MKIMVEMIGECVNGRMLDLRKALFRSTSLYFLAYDFGVKDRKGCESRGHNGVRFKPFVLIYGLVIKTRKVRIICHCALAIHTPFYPPDILTK